MSVNNLFAHKNQLTDSTGNVFYDWDFLDMVAKLVIRFDPTKETLDYLRDLVATCFSPTMFEH